MPTSTPFSLPADFLTNIYAAVGSFISGFALPIELIFGIGVAMWGMSWILGKVRSRSKG